jgi:type IV secretory pathway VirB2 component (pilin)
VATDRRLRLERAGEVTRVVAPLVALAVLAAAPAVADHPAPFRVEGMSPLTTALLTGGLAFLVALVVVVLIMVLTRKKPDAE